MELEQVAGAFEELVTSVEKDMADIVESHRSDCELDTPQQRACNRLWGDVVGTKRSSLITQLLCASFLPALKGAAFTWKQLGVHRRCVLAYARCLAVLEEVSAGSAYHAHWAAECALQAYKADHETSRHVSYARHWNAICYGSGVFHLFMDRLGWPKELLSFSDDLLKDKGASQQKVTRAADHS